MTFYSALLLGLVASLHCAGMCGGLQAVLGQTQVIRSPQQTMQHLILLNLGRILTYTLAGLVFAQFGGFVVTSMGIPQITTITRTILAIAIILLALQILAPAWRPWRWLEQPIARAWYRQLAQRDPERSVKSTSSLKTGLLWGLLPCGLVYGVLLTSLMAETATAGAAIMLGFGVGTLPALLLTGGLFQTFRNIVRARTPRLITSALFLYAGFSILFMPLLVDTQFVQYFPPMMNQLFCIN